MCYSLDNMPILALNFEQVIDLSVDLSAASAAEE